MTSGPAARDRRYLLLIPAAALIAVLPLILNGCSCGHDFDFHLLNWMEAARQFSHGNLHPHWAYTAAFNAGEPRFVFYPPLSWYLGALLGLLLTHFPGISQSSAWTAAPVLFTWIALAASGLAMYRLARAFAGPSAALIAATLYLANPYMLFTAYERTAYAELLAAAWIPLLLLAILRDRVTIARIALPVALLWLTNAPAAVMGSYTLAFLAALRILSMYRKNTGGTLEIAFRTAAGFVLGLGLAAFYIVPAAYERRFVQIAMATIGGMRIDQNFLFEHTGTTPDDLLHDQVLHTASLIAVLLLLAAAVALASGVLLQKRRSRTTSFPALSLALLVAAIAILLTPVGAILWKHAPEAAFLQFPWRLLAIVAPVFALATAAALGHPRLKFFPAAGMVLAFTAALTFPAVHIFRQPCDPEDTAPARLALFQSNAGTDPTDEYTPTTADNDALKPTDPPYWLAPDPTAAAPSAQPGPVRMQFTEVAPRAEDLVLNLRNYPSWRITVNGTPTPHPAERDDGLIAIPVPAGSSTIDIRYARTLDQPLGEFITVLALALFVFMLRRQDEPANVSER